jgi:hypothetical protein
MKNSCLGLFTVGVNDGPKPWFNGRKEEKMKSSRLVMSNAKGISRGSSVYDAGVVDFKQVTLTKCVRFVPYKRIPYATAASYIINSV